MDQDTRNDLRSAVTKARELLQKSVRDQLEGRYGIRKDGTVEPAEKLHLPEEEKDYRAQVVVHLDHIRASGLKPTDAVDQLVREVAFTHLNRLAAFKLMAARGLIRDAVGKGLKSNGFLFYLNDHPEDYGLFQANKQDVAYRHYLLHLGEEHARDVPALFSPTDPANRLFPDQRDLAKVLDLLNDDALAGIWDNDETLGWVYQYFTPKALREKARKESQAPRNSYELSFRNQFYTPRYVVEFLVDNTLGRTWYEMRKGDTALAQRCRYLVYRPDEVFLNEGQPEPDDEAVRAVRHRPKKDPRELRILDPAVGSAHFLLYGFDLLLVLYEEAYADPDLGPDLQRDYPTLGDLQKAVPALILERNLYGVDIDLRATQISALALWLRAQRAYDDLGLKPADRPPVTRANIVLAEPMPGEAKLLSDFVWDLRPPVLGQLVRAVFETMKGADEAGSLLKVEAALQGKIREAKEQWQEGGKEEQGELFAQQRQAQQGQLFNLSGVTDAAFWEEAESRVLRALSDYAEKAAEGERLSRRLFAGDAAQGFAFVDLLRQRFDVVLMNPPFGAASKGSKTYIDKTYPRTKNDVYAAFVERGLELLHRGGMLGAITSRTGFFLSSFQTWREEILLEEARPTVVADLGYGVLDTAMVEAAAYCLEAA